MEDLQPTTTPEAPLDPRLAKLVRLRNSAQFFYDLQKFRIATDARARPRHEEEITSYLDDDDTVFLGKMGASLGELEDEALKFVASRLKGIDVYENWLKHQRGVGPTMSAVLLSSYKIENFDTVSKVWAYSGLAVAPDGRAQRRVKGQQANFNPWLKAKLIKVLGDAFVKAYSWDPELQDYVVKRTKGGVVTVSLRAKDPGAPFPWRFLYDNRKNYRRSQKVPCMLCEGTGYLVTKSGKIAPCSSTTPNAAPCSNCEGAGVGPWGRSDAHRDLDARRFMIKAFLAELYVRWRRSLDLPVRLSYAEEKLGLPPHVGSSQYRL